MSKQIQNLTEDVAPKADWGPTRDMKTVGWLGTNVHDRLGCMA